ncbi:hypothetical protein CK203_015273 [Vitis vinifera]|uniref:Uncharacterized protein n=1 Tax=Vitis vinifera TaxID=29760 RepID=A0A438JKD8_VITVI|nr:hypothetical protein CK203_015273 [Vitis vinifera]
MEGPNGSLAWWWPKAQWASQRGPLDPGRSPFHPWGYFQVSPSPNLKTPHQSRRLRNHFPTFFFTLAPKLPAKLFHRRGHRDFYIYVCTPDQPHLPSHPRLCHPKSPNSRPTAMVVPLGPAKFYGGSLPRPRIYTDVKFNSSRVDPPVPVLDPFLSWAEEAHWSMGGLNFKRHRLQGRIEGSIKKLRAERERLMRKAKRVAKGSPPSIAVKIDDSVGGERLSPSSPCVSPPPAPVAVKRRRFVVDDDEEDDEEELVRRKLARKLGDDFDKVAPENVKGKGLSSADSAKTGGGPVNSVATRTRSRRSEEHNSNDGVMEVVEQARRSSPRGKKLKGDESKGSGEKKGSPTSGISSSPRTSPRLSKRKSS